MNSVTEALVDRCNLSGEIRPKRRGHRFFGVTHLPPHRTMNIFLKRRFIKSFHAVPPAVEGLLGSVIVPSKDVCNSPGGKYLPGKDLADATPDSLSLLYKQYSSLDKTRFLILPRPLCKVHYWCKMIASAAAVLAIPLSLLYFWLTHQICLGTFIIALLCIVFVFVGIPLIFRYSYTVQRNLLFLNFVNIPNVNFNKPASLGLVGARNLHITTNDNVNIGVWHTLPVKHQLEAVAHSWLTNSKGNQRYDQWMQREVVVIYCHGNAGNRASEHRVQLYKLLNQLNYHVVAFDYRGYADSSSSETNEQSVVEDAKAVIAWVQERVTSGHVFVWGHSLGTAVAAHALAEMEAEGKHVSGLVLEAPFNNLSDEIREYPIAQIFTILPWFDFCIIDPVYENNLRFESDKNLRNVSAAILILHAENDRVVPYKLGRKLYNTVKDYRKDDNTIQFVSFESKLGHGHKFIYRDRRTSSIIKNFVERNLKNKPRLA